jgi:hypothetical protein
LVQPPWPSQVPSGPQVAFVLAGHSERGTPAGTKEQVPKLSDTLQALQVSLQAVSQQMLSTQNPVRHSRSQLQDSPCPLDWLTVLDEQVGPASEPLASFFPPPSVATRWGLTQPAAPKTADRPKAPKKAFTPRDDLDP